jgi:hypothetical protein
MSPQEAAKSAQIEPNLVLAEGGGRREEEEFIHHYKNDLEEAEEEGECV